MTACSADQHVPVAATPQPIDTANSAPAPSTTTNDFSVFAKVTGSLSYDGLRKDGLCQFGGQRPCFAPLRTEPHFSKNPSNPTANYLNPGRFDSRSSYTAITWPYEASADRPADQLAIACRVQGDDVYDATDTPVHSMVWDAVIIPPEHSLRGVTEVGYTPERWVRLAHSIAIGACSHAENPANALVVTTPSP